MMTKIQNSKKGIALFAVKTRKMAHVGKMFDFDKIKKKDKDDEKEVVKDSVTHD